MVSENKLKQACHKASLAYQEALHAWQKDPEVVRLRNELYKAEIDARCRLAGEQERLHTVSLEAEKAWNKAKQEKRSLIPEDLAKKRFAYGGPNPELIWWSDDHRFVLLKVKGHMSWCSIGEQSYGPTSHFLIDLNRAVETPNGLIDISIRPWNLKEWSGRFGNTQKKEMMELIKKSIEETA